MLSRALWLRHNEKRHACMPTLYKRYGNNSDVIAALVLVTQAAHEKPAKGVAI